MLEQTQQPDEYMSKRRPTADRCAMVVLLTMVGGAGLHVVLTVAKVFLAPPSEHLTLYMLAALLFAWIPALAICLLLRPTGNIPGLVLVAVVGLIVIVVILALIGPNYSMLYSLSRPDSRGSTCTLVEPQGLRKRYVCTGYVWFEYPACAELVGIPGTPFMIEVSDEDYRTVTLLAACGPSSVEHTAQATEIAAQVPGTLTAQAPPIIPTIAPQPLLDISDVLMLDDLPPGFNRKAPEALGFDQDDFALELAEVQGGFIFFNEEDFELIIGLAMFLPNRPEQAEFDVLLVENSDNINILVAGMASRIGGQMGQQAQISGIEDVGQVSVAYTVVTEGDPPLRWDAAAFRSANVGVLAVIAYIDGNTAPVPYDEVVRLIEANILFDPVLGG